jgi:hypothetical protein
MNEAGKSLSPGSSNDDVAALIGEAIRVRTAFKVAETAARCGDLSARFIVRRCLHDEPKTFAAVKARLQAQGRGVRVLWERFLDVMEAV